MDESGKLIQVGPISQNRVVTGGGLVEMLQKALYPGLQTGAGSQFVANLADGGIDGPESSSSSGAEGPCDKCWVRRGSTQAACVFSKRVSHTLQFRDGVPLRLFFSYRSGAWQWEHSCSTGLSQLANLQLGY